MEIDTTLFVPFRSHRQSFESEDLLSLLLEGSLALESLLGPRLLEPAKGIMNLSLQGPVFLPIK